MVQNDLRGGMTPVAALVAHGRTVWGSNYVAARLPS